jgi:membrane protease YdiL (CAAX protease family)
VSTGNVQGDRLAGRWHPLVRVALYFVVMAAVNRIAFAGVASLLPSVPDWLLDLLEGGVYLAGIVVLTWVFMRCLDRQPLVSLGLQAQGGLLRLLLGLGLGAGLIGLVFVTMVTAGWLVAEPGRLDLLPFLASALSWAALSFVEELTFRGYILQGLARAWIMPIAVAVSSLLFGVVHLIDPNAQLLAVLNISVAGLFFAVAYLVTRSLWLPAGIHIGWNLAEIHLLGFPGSGHTEPSLLRSTVGGPEWLTGGAFGPEGGILGLAAWLLGIALLLGYRAALGRRAHAPGRRSLN